MIVDSLERQARCYAVKKILVLFSTISIFVVVGYIDLFWLFGLVAAMFVVMVAGALYNDAYYTKLVELEVQKYDAKD
jgi:hypothetical protein